MRNNKYNTNLAHLIEVESNKSILITFANILLKQKEKEENNVILSEVLINECQSIGSQFDLNVQTENVE